MTRSHPHLVFIRKIMLKGFLTRSHLSDLTQILDTMVHASSTYPSLQETDARSLCRQTCSRSRHMFAEAEAGYRQLLGRNFRCLSYFADAWSLATDGKHSSDRDQNRCMLSICQSPSVC